jgi:hypothetical protein
LSPTKKELEEERGEGLSKISNDNLKKFDTMMRMSFGLPSCQDIYPQYEATPLEKSIGLTERFFGRRPRYYNIMNKTLKK